MSNKEKNEYRQRTLELIEELNEKVKHIKPVSLRHYKSELGQTEQLDGIYQYWNYDWKIDATQQSAKDFIEAATQVYSMINSGKGAKNYPKGLFRELLEFSDNFEDLSIETKEYEHYIGLHIDIENIEESIKRAIQEKFTELVQKSFINPINKIKRAILIFENERDESEPSFIE